MKFTKNQNLAIKKSDGNILVSASAGSGKTGVLKERVIEKLKSGINIDELVILTFTEAAASEMKSRILNEIYKENLSNQIEKIDNAIISTFDAFTLKLVKEYHYLLGLNNNIGIVDPVIIMSRETEIINEVLKKYYIENNKSFNQLFHRYFSKSSDWLEKSVYSIAKSLKKNPNYFEIINNYDEIYLNDKVLDDYLNDYFKFLRKDLTLLKLDFEKEYLERVILDNDYQDYLLKLDELVNTLLKSDNEEFFKIISLTDLPKKPRNKELVKPEIHIYIENLKKEFSNLFVEEYSDFLSNFNESVDSVKTILEIVKDYLLEFEKIKIKEELFSFDDIMFLAIRLFEEFPDVRNKFKGKVKEILVDEYQDTNDLQDYFISLISDNNLFMVGDVKQSIYRFRDANPNNFMRIYTDYQKNNTGSAIFLQENFRTNAFVLEEINKIFKKIMTESNGGIDYSNEQVLVTGFDEAFGLHEKDSFILALYDLEKINQEYKELNRAEIEAHLVAQDIKKRIDGHEKLYSLKNGKYETVDYKDVTILASQKVDFFTYAKIISSYNIPIQVFKDEPFFSSDEISLIFQYLILIMCFKDEEYFKKYFKTSLYAVARSFVYKIKDQEISDYLAFEKLEKISDIDSLLNYKNLKNVYEDITEIIAKSWLLPPVNILENVYRKLDIYRHIAELDNPRNKEEKLDFFLLKVKGFKDFSFMDLIKYLEIIIENNDFDIQYAEEKKQVNAVRLMSMHQSKGLQFPVCYIIGLYKQFNNSENKESFVFNKNYGILTKSYHDGFYFNFVQKLYFNKEKQEDISERIRLLYVAMTRAVNKLVIFLDYDERLLVNNNKPLSLKHLLYQGLNLSQDDVIDFQVLDNDIKKLKIEKTDDDIKLLKFNFKEEDVKKIKYSKRIVEILDDETISFIDLGNKYHQLLEKIDFFDVEDSIKDFPDRLKKSIKHLVNTDIFKDLENPSFYQEYEFYQEKDSVIFKGIIDLLVIDRSAVYVIDYKLKNIDDDSYITQLKGYKNFLEDKIDKPIKIFLYSLFDEVLKEVFL